MHNLSDLHYATGSGVKELGTFQDICPFGSCSVIVSYTERDQIQLFYNDERPPAVSGFLQHLILIYLLTVNCSPQTHEDFQNSTGQTRSLRASTWLSQIEILSAVFKHILFILYCIVAKIPAMHDEVNEVNTAVFYK